MTIPDAIRKIAADPELLRKFNALTPQQIADMLAQKHLNPCYSHGGIRDDIAAIVTEDRARLTNLATLILRTLDAQQQYFKTRSRFDLIASKALEKELRKAAIATLGLPLTTESDPEVDVSFRGK